MENIMDIVKLFPAEKDNLWGGVKLKEKYGKKTDMTPLAETWELAFHKDGKSRLADGRTLEEAVGEKEIGKNAADFPFFPTLIKFIDAKEDLSVQVHPSDEYALKNENSFGKTEMWYIVEADEGAGIYLGFSRDVTREEFEQAIRENSLTSLMNFYPVKAGECYFIPSGTIHAIGAGCLISEIQQNSNLTYRVYDWGRVDKFGNGRELHVEKAKAVTNLQKFESTTPNIATSDGELIGASRYFHTTKITLSGEKILSCDAASFRSLSCVSGEGEIDGAPFSQGDTFFVPAGYGDFKLSGKAIMVMTEIRKYYVGIDLGGTFIKGGIVDDLGRILISDKAPTESEGGAEAVARNIAKLTESLLSRLGLTGSDVEGIGMGVPGMINSKAGIVTYSNNLAWESFAISESVEKLTGLKTKIANDANVAALGEVKFGGGKNLENVIMITLGTGVGGGIVLDGRLYEGNEGAGAELGHSCISVGGEPCTCGRRGCLEAYASATALIRDTKRAMESHPESKMWDVAKNLSEVDGATAFRMKDTDEIAKSVVDHYIEMLGAGLANIANVFRPEAILIGGGVSAEGDNLIIPLRKYVEENIFAGSRGPGVLIKVAELGNRAGIMGAAALIMD